MQPTKERIALSPETNEALKTLGWEGHKFEKGDWCLTRKNVICLITGSPYHRGVYDAQGGMRPGQEGEWVNCRMGVEVTTDFSYKVENLTPLPHWEDDIEPILEGLGYTIRFDMDGPEDERYHQAIVRRGIKQLVVGEDYTRQLAMMRAVISLAKEVGK